ncbi:MAG: sigma-54-dependent Fis family transcriptional regulator [Methanoregulaceae archaeon]|nr:sigma-54-dependent Fis family transcriptional regulator [Methanoregulaceae archaeon]
MKTKLLIVDDEPNIRRILQMAFEKVGYVAVTAEDVPSALQMIGEEHPDCIITDVTMPGVTGYELLREVKATRPDLPVVIMTAFGTIPQAVQAIRDGAFEYVTKPFDLDALKRIVAAAIDEPAPVRISKPSAKATPSPRFIAESPAMREVFETAVQVADSRATVLITGESGVGKEVVAKALHEHSSRSSKPFVAVSCAALPETLLESELFGYEKGAFTGAQGTKPGRFELADKGTLFLDEIGEIPMAIQVKLLRVLQEREFERLGSSKPTRVDVRVVTATNRDLRQAVDEGIFRLDLLYRLQVVELHIPPLRERIEDIQPLAEHFLHKYCAENERPLLTLSEETLEKLQGYRWPGNVRELENTIERGVVLAQASETELVPKLLPPSILKAA